MKNSVTTFFFANEFFTAASNVKSTQRVTSSQPGVDPHPLSEPCVLVVALRELLKRLLLLARLGGLGSGVELLESSRVGQPTAVVELIPTATGAGAVAVLEAALGERLGRRGFLEVQRQSHGA